MGKNKYEKYLDIYEFILDNDESLFAKDVDKKQNIKLFDNDLVTIRPIKTKVINQYVIIEGLVRFPGRYSISNNNEKITDIIERAGGLLDNAYLGASEFFRDGNKIRLSFEKIVRSPRSRLNFPITNGDRIVIKQKTNIVEVRGEVNNPGFYQFLKGARFDEYIDLAGGYKKNAAKYGSFVLYPDGSANELKLISRSPEVKDGSIISVLAKEEAEPFNLTQYVTNLTSIYADLSQSYLLLILAARGN